MKDPRVSGLARAWTSIGRLMNPRTEADYEETVELMEVLLDLVGTDESHEYYSLLDGLGDAVLRYESKKYPTPNVKGVDCLKFLMDQHKLRQSDLREEIGTQGVVSEILRGRRELNKRQIDALRRRFNVPADVFFPDVSESRLVC